MVPTALAAISMAAYQPLFFAGVARTDVAVGTIVAIGSPPVLAGVLGLVVHGERPGHGWAVATILAVLGCSLLDLGQRRRKRRHRPWPLGHGRYRAGLGRWFGLRGILRRQQGAAEGTRTRLGDGHCVLSGCATPVSFAPAGRFELVALAPGSGRGSASGPDHRCRSIRLIRRGPEHGSRGHGQHFVAGRTPYCTVLGALLLDERLAPLPILGSGLLLGGLALLSTARKDAGLTRE